MAQNDNAINRKTQSYILDILFQVQCDNTEIIS